MIKISHEVPLSMLEDSRNFNDYDYALVHLFEEYPKYLEFFKKSLDLGREVLLDNSIFELGEAFDMDEFAKWIIDLKPTKYIIPDVLGNGPATVNNIELWNNKFKDLPGIKIGVVQGSTYKELTECYLRVANTCDEIAICFHYPYYEQTDKGKMIGRQNLINDWINDGFIDKSKKHHLLGCSLPQEFSFYKDMDFIYSLDTSNPIVHGLLNTRYIKGEGLPFKKEMKLVDLIEEFPNLSQSGDISYNLDEFRKLLK